MLLSKLYFYCNSKISIETFQFRVCDSLAAVYEVHMAQPVLCLEQEQTDFSTLSRDG